MKLFRILSALFAASMAVMTLPASADAIADFYSGKQISLVIGYGTGGGYDLYARLLARFIGGHIPGKPTIVVQNMPGAGSRRAANWLYKVAPKDTRQFNRSDRRLHAGGWCSSIRDGMHRRGCRGSSSRHC